MKSIPQIPWRRAALLSVALISVSASQASASTAYGSLNNFDVVNDTGQKCYGFEIELDDIHTSSITYTYDYNHYGTPRITEDNTDPAHPKVFVRHESKKNPDGSYASFTNPQDPAHPLAPTDGHAFTNPGVNLGGEHFGVGYYGAPSAVKYHWLIDDPARPGTLILGPAVSIATPIFSYVPAIPDLAPARVVAVIEPEPPEVPDDAKFGVPTWVKIFKTVQPSGRQVRLNDLLTDDVLDPDSPNWAGDEAPETEIEWKIFQKRPARDPGEPGADEVEGADDLPNGDEVVTRRYEFYAYNGPVNEEDGEAQCDNPENCPDAVGAYIGAQMAGFNVESPLGLVDHLQDGDASVPYINRTVVVGGNSPYIVTIPTGALPDGLNLDSTTGILSGTPTVAGVFTFTVNAMDADEVKVSKDYTMTIVAPPVIVTESLPDGTEKASYSVNLMAEGGTGPYTWSVNPALAGLTLDPGGLLSGVPSVGTAGTHDLTLTVTDSLGNTASVTLTLVIKPAPVPPPKRGDVNRDGIVDLADFILVLAARNQPASGPNDPRDLDGDGRITVRDARIVVTLFTPLDAAK